MARSVDIVAWTMPKRYIYVEHVGPYFQVGEAINRLFSVRGIYDVVLQPLQLMSIWLDDPDVVPPQNLRSHVAAFVDPMAKVPDHALEGYLPAGRYARLIHKGSYSDLPDVWKFFYTVWLRASDEKLRQESPGFEIYRNSPLEVPRHQLITELYIPLA